MLTEVASGMASLELQGFEDLANSLQRFAEISDEDLEKMLQEEVAGKITGAVDPAALEKEL